MVAFVSERVRLVLSTDPASFSILYPMDTVSKEARSRMMAGIRGTNTKGERLVRSALFARGFRFRINAPDLPGKPDLKLTKHRAVILVHGCFWHGHACRYFRLPASNVPFWTDKIAKNRTRDLRNVAGLREAGWRVCIIWECLLRSVLFKSEKGKVFDLLAAWIEGEEPFLELFDAAAMRSSIRDYAEYGSGTVGLSNDAAAFAAERTERYGTV